MAIAKDVASKTGSVGQRLPGLRGRGGDGGDGDGAPVSGTGRGRRLPVQEHIHVAVPIDTAYDQWTQFEEFPKFMRGVEHIEQRDDTTLVWTEKLWGVRRSWVAEITDQRPLERIAWRSTSGPKHAGVVTFHRLSDRLTQVEVSLDHQPTGLFERAASGMRYTRRALESDLKRFKALVEMSEEPTGAWRGRVEEGEVTEESDEQPRDREDREAWDDREQEHEQTHGEGGAEFHDEEPDEEEEQREEEPERTSRPRRRAQAKDEDGEADERQRPRPRRRAAAGRRQ